MKIFRCLYVNMPCDMFMVGELMNFMDCRQPLVIILKSYTVQVHKPLFFRHTPA